MAVNLWLLTILSTVIFSLDYASSLKKYGVYDAVA